MLPIIFYSAQQLSVDQTHQLSTVVPKYLRSEESAAMQGTYSFYTVPSHSDIQHIVNLSSKSITFAVGCAAASWPRP